jgi:hypothetical protein
MGKRDSGNRYAAIIEWVFRKSYVSGATEVPFTRETLSEAATALGVELPKNLGDNIYSYRHRVALPSSILETERDGLKWIIRSEGRAKYRFVLAREVAIVPNPALVTTRIPDATPGLIQCYALGDEQALLAKLRYNRLVDIFLGITCYSLQNHLRTTVKGIGQIEIDELYVGIDRRGAHFAVPVQAKGGKDKIGVVQVEQDLRYCAEKFPDLVCRPVAAQFVTSDIIALFELTQEDGTIRLVRERRYQLVPSDGVSPEDLSRYSRDSET